MDDWSEDEELSGWERVLIRRGLLERRPDVARGAPDLVIAERIVQRGLVDARACVQRGDHIEGRSPAISGANTSACGRECERAYLGPAR